MLGHRLWLEMRRRGETYATVRGAASDYEHLAIFEPRYLVDRFEATDAGRLAEAFRQSRPDVVFNAAASIRPHPMDPLQDLAVNSLLPHRLALLCSTSGARLIHVSSDAVFSGSKGGYAEAAAPDAEDQYGRSKTLGEVDEPWALTIRTCPVGRELLSTRSLVEWFLSQRGGTVRGYAHARFSGLTAGVVAGVLAGVADRHPSLRGIRHLAGPPLAKLQFLHLLNTSFACNTRIEPDESVRTDRTLDGSLLEREIGFSPPTWDQMLSTLREDAIPYDTFHPQAHPHPRH